MRLVVPWPFLELPEWCEVGPIIDLNWAYFRVRSCAICVTCRGVGCPVWHMAEKPQWRGRKGAVVTTAVVEPSRGAFCLLWFSALFCFCFCFFVLICFACPRGGRSFQREAWEKTYPEKPSDLRQPPKPLATAALPQSSSSPGWGRGSLFCSSPLRWGV